MPTRSSRRYASSTTSEESSDDSEEEEVKDDSPAAVVDVDDASDSCSSTDDAALPLNAVRLPSGEIIHVGDFVHVDAAEWYKAVVPAGVWIARLDRVIIPSRGRRRVAFTWMYAPEELATGRCAFHLRNEVFLTSHSDTNDVDTIITKVQVVHLTVAATAYLSAPAARDAAAAVPSYVCRFFYDTNTRSLRPARSVEVFTHIADVSITSPVPAAASDGPRKRARMSSDGIDDDLTAAAAALSLSFTPEQLPGRTVEVARMTGLLRDALRSNDATGAALYVHGMPGTGKTACVRGVMRALGAEADLKGSFVAGEINGLTLSAPPQVYSHLYKLLTGGRYATPDAALHRLNAHFKSSVSPSDRTRLLVLMDELDCLVTRSQDVLYTLFDWAAAPGSGFIIVACANTMDLPERLLPKIASRLPETARIAFSSYSSAQLVDIVTARLKSLPASVMNSDAIRLAAARVAAITGDARRALHLCRRAVLIAQERHRSGAGAGDADGAIVHVADVSAAAAELQDSVAGRMLSSSSQTSIAIVIVCAEAALSDGRALDLARVATRVQQLATLALHGRSAVVEPSSRGQSMIRDARDDELALLKGVAPMELLAPLHALVELRIVDMMFPWSRRESNPVMRLAASPHELSHVLAHTRMGSIAFGEQ